MRYLLDTNIIVFLSSGKGLSSPVLDIIDDFSNRFYVSALSAIELTYLVNLRKIETDFKNISEWVDSLKNEFFIDILHTKDEHLKTLDEISSHIHHNDPIDLFIISQAITEKLTLISSDRKFENYTSQNLNFVYNKR